MKRFLFWLRLRSRAPSDAGAMLFGLAALVAAFWWSATHHALAQLGGAAAGVAAMASGGPGYGGPPHTFLFDTWRPDSGRAVVSGTSLTVTATTTSVQDFSIDGTCTINGVDCATAFVPSPTPTPSLDPLVFTHGTIQSEGVPAVYMNDTFTRADVANITGTPIENGGVNWQVAAFGGFVAFTIGVQSNAAVCTNPFCNGGGGRGLTAEYVDTGRSDETLSVDVHITQQTSLFYARMNAAATSGWYAYVGGANHLCLEGFGAGAPGATCSAGSAVSNGTATLSMSGNTLTLAAGSQTVTVTSAFQNSGTRAGLGWGQNGDGPESFTNFVVGAPLLPIGLSVQGNYTNGTHATIVLGETLNGIDFSIPDNTGAFRFHQAMVLSSSLAVAGASNVHALNATDVTVDEINVGNSSSLIYRFSCAANLDFPLHGPLDQSFIDITCAGGAIAAGDHCKVTTALGSMNGTVDCDVLGGATNNVEIAETCVNGAAGTCDTLLQAYHVEVTNQ